MIASYGISLRCLETQLNILADFHDALVFSEMLSIKLSPISISPILA